MKDVTLIHYNSTLVENALVSYHNNGKNTSAKLNNRTQRAASNDITTRVINYWEKEGLLTTFREGAAGWRKYSIMDNVWLLLIQELRTFGYPIESLKKLRANVFEENKFTNDITPFYIECYIAVVLSLKISAFINILPDGKYVMASQAEMRALESHKYFAVNSHITISVNHLLTKATGKNWYAINEESALTAKEIQIMNELSSGKYVEATIFFKNGEMERVQLTEILDKNVRLNAIFKDNDYEDITLKRADGKTQSIKRIISKKLK